jgi:hypothetical protein
VQIPQQETFIQAQIRQGSVTTPLRVLCQNGKPDLIDGQLRHKYMQRRSYDHR